VTSKQCYKLMILFLFHFNLLHLLHGTLYYGTCRCSVVLQPLIHVLIICVILLITIPAVIAFVRLKISILVIVLMTGLLSIEERLVLEVT